MSHTQFLIRSHTNGEKTAIENYAKHYNLEESVVTIDEVEKSSEGVVHWANLHVDVRAGTALNSKFLRAVKKDGKARVIPQ